MDDQLARVRTERRVTRLVLYDGSPEPIARSPTCGSTRTRRVARPGLGRMSA